MCYLFHGQQFASKNLQTTNGSISSCKNLIWFQLDYLVVTIIDRLVLPLSSHLGDIISRASCDQLVLMGVDSYT